MRAAVHRRYGPPDVVGVTDHAAPSPGRHEVLVKVHASTVNRTDCAYRAGKPFVVRLFGGLPHPKVAVWGCEFAGEVAAAGGEVRTLRVGDRVFGYDERTFGGHAEYLTIDARRMIGTVPPNVTFAQAAAATEGAHYALAFINKAKLGSDDRVLVYGASGGIGSAAVQLLKSIGAFVTAVCSTEQVPVVADLGADKVVDYTVEDFTADELAYDVVLDAVGKSTFGACRRLLKPGGAYLSSELGPYGQNPLLALVTPLLGGRKVHFPIPRQDPAIATYLRGLLESGAFTPLIDRHYALDEIVEAYRYVESGRKVGNVVLDVVAPAAGTG